VKLTIKKGVLDRRVALQVGMSPRDVSLITATFLSMVREELAELNAVVLDGVGSIRVVAREGKVDKLRPVNSTPIVTMTKKKYYVSFKKSEPLTAAIRERHGGAEVEVNCDEEPNLGRVPPTRGSTELEQNEGSVEGAGSLEEP
jgi:nucleoid DNA-binding protein